ncbi:hypothetical protein AMA1_23 [Achromobacter phage AMA1]|nr:hypothetical protein AMA1_23 [Achromobacter phage AMA1]
MATGLRVRDPNTGEIVMDTTYRVGRVLDTLFTTANSGSIYNAGLAQGEMFYRIGITNNQNVYPSTNFITSLMALSVWASGTTLNWSITWRPGQALPAGYVYAIMYGVR